MAAADLRLELAERHGVLVARLQGELDRDDTGDIGQEVMDALGVDGSGLVCDLSALAYIDSAGVHMLHRFARTLKDNGQRIAAVPPRADTPRRVLELTGIPTVIPLLVTVEDAVRAVAAGE